MRRHAATWLATAALLAAPEAEAARRALILANAHYARHDQGWWDLASETDAELLAEALTRLDFTVDVRHDLDREGLVAALDALAAAAAPGDHLLVHYSGHGQGIADQPGGDELDDGLDEALVPVDAPLRDPDGTYDGGRHLRDDELGLAIAALRRAAGPGGSVVVTVDACHSGTVSRGGVTRGGPPMSPPRTRGPALPVGSGFAPADDPGGAPLVVLSAARANQTAKESVAELKPGRTAAVGAFTLALTRALADPSLGTWSAVHEVVRRDVMEAHADQVPQLEGEAHLRVFGAEVVAVEPYFEVRDVRGGRAQIQGGLLHGLNVGARVSFQPAGALAPDPSTALAAGTVVQAVGTMAKVELDAPPTGPLRAARAFVTAPVAGDARLGVRVALDREAARAWTAALGSGRLWLSEPHDEGQLVLRRCAAGADRVRASAEHAAAAVHAAAVPGCEGLALVPADDLDRALATGPEAPEGPLVDALEALQRGLLVREVSLHNPSFAVEVALLRAERDDFGACVPAEGGLTTAAGETAVPLGAAWQVQITPRGDTAAYITALYLDRDGRAAQLYPLRGQTPARVQPGGGPLTLPICVSATPPVGVEQLRVFATREPVDLGPVLGYAATRGAADPLQLLINQLGAGTRGAEATPELRDGHTVAVPITVYDPVEDPAGEDRP